MDVTRVAWPLMQRCCFLPEEGQFPQYRPGPQSVAAEHASRTWQFPLKQEAEEVKKKEEEKSNTKRCPMVEGAIAIRAPVREREGNQT